MLAWIIKELEKDLQKEKTAPLLYLPIEEFQEEIPTEEEKEEKST